MENKRLRNNKGQFKKASKNSEFGFVNLSTYTSPEIVEVKGEDYIRYGADNNYFQFLIDRFNGSPTNNAAITGISQAIFGKGLNATDSSRKPNEYAQMIALFPKNDVRKLAYDLKLMGQCAMQIIYTKDRKKIAKVEHFPIETLRAERANKDGEIEAYYYFADWPNIKKSDTPLRIPAFGTSKESIEMLYVKPYKSGFYYYSPVDYQGALQYAELEEEVSNYHINNIRSGLSPSMLINFNNGTPNEQERQLIEQKIADKFAGTNNAGKFIIAFNDNKESQAEITPVQLSDAHNQYQFLSSECSLKIQVGHRIVSSFLLGIPTATGFSSNADEIKVSSQLMDNTVIRPFQELLIDSFDIILAYNDIALNLYFTTLQPLEFTEVDNDIQDKETIEEETGVEMAKLSLNKIDGEDVYKTKEEAIAQANLIGCEGFHEMEIEGDIYFMPCENHTELKSPCWDGYEQIGTKEKDGKEVPNCVPLSKESLSRTKEHTCSLSSDKTQFLLGSLSSTGNKMSEDWIQVDELEEESNLSNEDWANYLIQEKPKSTLNKIKDVLGLNQDYVTSKNNGSAYSDIDSKNGLYKIRYKYALGASKGKNTRDFCSNMMDMSDAGMVWRIEDIDQASRGDVNVEFRHKPSIEYNIFELKGGIYCHHKWKRVLYRKESNTEVSKNLSNYKKTRTIPKSQQRFPRGSAKAAIATIKQPGQGRYPLSSVSLNDKGYKVSQRRGQSGRWIKENETCLDLAGLSSKSALTTAKQARDYSKKLNNAKSNNPNVYWSVSEVSQEQAQAGVVIDKSYGSIMIAPNGDIKGLFKNPETNTKGVGPKLVQQAVNNGGRTLDNFDIPYLTKIYTDAGFRISGRIPFDEQYKPDGWVKELHGTPDVVSMIYDPKNELDIREQRFSGDDGYDEMIRYRNSSLNICN